MSFQLIAPLQGGDKQMLMGSPKNPQTWRSRSGRILYVPPTLNASLQREICAIAFKFI